MVLQPRRDRVEWKYGRSKPNPRLSARLASGAGTAFRGKIERTAHPSDTELPAEPRDGFQNGRSQVRVLVGVEMAGLDSRLHDALYLGAHLIINANAPPRHGNEQIFDRQREGFAREDRAPAHENEMDSQVERRGFAREPHGVVECRTVRHHGGGGENAVAMRFDNARIDVRREAEIVGVDDQLFLAFQNRVNRMVRNFLGFARISRARA